MKKETPCRATCKLTPDDICVGCYRLAEEIVNWNKKTEQERQNILLAAVKRKVQWPYESLIELPLRPITSLEYRKYKKIAELEVVDGR